MSESIPSHWGTAGCGPGPRRRAGGFSLLEMLVAVALFAIAAGLAYGGLQALVASHARGSEAKQRLGELQFAMGLFERDVWSVVQRGVRDVHGAPLPELLGAAGRIELTRYGPANALGVARAELERVAWLRRENHWVRQRWAVLDRAPGSRPIEDELVDGVLRMEVVYLDAQGREQRQWPPPRGAEQRLPRALRLSLELEGLGEIRRVLELPAEPAA